MSSKNVYFLYNIYYVFFVNEVNVMDYNDFVYFFPQLHNAGKCLVPFNVDFISVISIDYTRLFYQESDG